MTAKTFDQLTAEFDQLGIIALEKFKRRNDWIKVAKFTRAGSLMAMAIGLVGYVIQDFYLTITSITITTICILILVADIWRIRRINRDIEVIHSDLRLIASLMEKKLEEKRLSANG